MFEFHEYGRYDPNVLEELQESGASAFSIRGARQTGWVVVAMDGGTGNDSHEMALVTGDYVEVADDSEMGFHFEFPNLDPELFECLESGGNRFDPFAQRR